MLNKHGLADKMARFWSYVATNFKDYDNLLGYELLNEPHGIDMYTSSKRDLIPGK